MARTGFVNINRIVRQKQQWARVVLPGMARSGGWPRLAARGNRALTLSTSTQTTDHVMLITSSAWGMMRFRMELIDACIAQGLRVTAATDLAPHDCTELRRRGAAPVVIPIDSAGQNPARDLICFAAMVRLLRAVRPDVVHLFGTKPNIYGSIAAKLSGTSAIVASVIGRGLLASGNKRLLSSSLRPLIRLALESPTRAVFQNLEDRAWYLDNGFIKSARTIHIPGSGVDTEALKPAPGIAPEARRTFVLAARMLWSKGIGDFVEAARQVKVQHPDVSFVLFGGSKDDYKSNNPDFIDRALLEALTREGVVCWRGFSAPHVVEEAMRRAAAVVLPSYYAEGVPRALIEGAAAGAPIITTDMPGCRDVVEPGCSGYLVPPKSPERLAAAMCELLAQPRKICSMGEASRRIAVTKFDSRGIIAQTMALYEEALGRPLRLNSENGWDSPLSTHRESTAWCATCRRDVSRCLGKA